MSNFVYTKQNRPRYFEGRRYTSELEASWAALYEDFEEVDFGDPKDVLGQWNEARNQIAWKWDE